MMKTLHERFEHDTKYGLLYLNHAKMTIDGEVRYEDTKTQALFNVWKMGFDNGYDEGYEDGMYYMKDNPNAEV